MVVAVNFWNSAANPRHSLEMTEIKNYIFLQQLQYLPFVQAIWLYGSRARGDENERSDIDLAIVCRNATEADWLTVLKQIEQADTLLKIDCVRFDALALEDPLRTAILKDRIVLFDRNFTMYPWYQTFVMLGDALNRFEEMVHEPENRTSYVQDATIQRFEFCVELFWKVLKKIAESEGYEVTSPKNTLQTAYAMKLIDDEKIWLAMMVDRNLTSHTYRKALASEIYHRAKGYLGAMKKTYALLGERYHPIA